MSIVTDLPEYDSVDLMVAWENGSLSQHETAEFFQYLIDIGLCWQLQGCYGRQAQSLIDAGICHARTTTH